MKTKKTILCKNCLKRIANKHGFCWLCYLTELAIKKEQAERRKNGRINING